MDNNITLALAKAYAKEYTDALANGQVKTNTGDITTMKGQIASLEAGTYDDTELLDIRVKLE